MRVVGAVAATAVTGVAIVVGVVRESVMNSFSVEVFQGDD